MSERPWWGKQDPRVNGPRRDHGTRAISTVEIFVTSLQSPCIIGRPPALALGAAQRAEQALSLCSPRSSRAAPRSARHRLLPGPAASARHCLATTLTPAALALRAKGAASTVDSDEPGAASQQQRRCHHPARPLLRSPASAAAPSHHQSLRRLRAIRCRSSTLPSLLSPPRLRCWPRSRLLRLSVLPCRRRFCRCCRPKPPELALRPNRCAQRRRLRASAESHC